MIKKSLFQALAAVTLFMSFSAFAQTPPPPPPAPGQGAFGTAQIHQITRQNMGQWYRLLLRRPLVLSLLEVEVLSASVKIHEVSLVTESRTRISVQGLNNTAVLPAGQSVASENLNPYSRIIAIDIRAESFGAYSDILVRAYSPEGYPEMILDESVSPPAPTPQPPRGDLSGSCEDQDHAQFYVAKAFAYSSNGLSMDDAGAGQWALSYNTSHRCGTIQEFVARFTPLRDVAYSTDGLNLDARGAGIFALRFVDQVTRAEAMEIVATIRSMKDFAYASNGMNLDDMRASGLAARWVENRCENSQELRPLRAKFQKERDFAYSSSGLNMSSEDAVRYASGKIASMTRCGNLLPR